MTTLTDLLSKSREYDGRKENYNSQSWRAEFDPKCSLQLTDRLSNVTVPGHVMTENAWNQFCAKMGAVAYGRGSTRVLPRELITAWAKNFPAELSGLLNAHLKAYKGGALVRTYDNRVRAFLSGQYAIVDNSELLETAIEGLKLMNISGAERMDTMRSTVTPDELHVKVTLVNVKTNDEPNNGHYGVGFYLGNNEIGGGKLQVAPYIQRHSCTNSIVYTGDESGMSAYHRGNGRLLADRMALAMGHALKMSQHLLTEFINSKQVVIPDFHKEVLNFAEAQGWDVDMTSAIMHGAGGSETLFGFVNGLTYAAHSRYADPLETVAIEKLAGNVLMHPRQSFKNAAWLRQAVAVQET